MIIFTKIAYKKFCVILFLLLFLILPSKKALADNFSAGKEALNKNNFSQALDYFTVALKENQTDPERLYYLGLTLKKMGESERATKAFDAALKLKPKADLAKAIQSQRIYTNSNNTKIDNYFQDAIRNNQVFRWDLNKMPLKVFIAPGDNVKNYTPEYKQMVTKALDSWRYSMKGKITFTSTDNAKNANIKIAWIDKLDGTKIGLCPYKFINFTIINSDVVLSTTVPNGRPKTLPEMYQIALHELGHALGIKGHSPNPNDIMYAILDEEKNLYLTQRDINTMNMLYQKQANISNSLPLNMENTKLYHKYLLNGDKYVLNKDYKTALNYYLSATKLYSGDYESLNDVANCYYRLKDYQNALKYYLQSLKLKSRDNDIQNSTADCYYYLKDYQNAIKYYQASLKTKPNDFDSNYWAACCYSRLKDYANAIRYYELSKTINPNDTFSWYNCAMAQMNYAYEHRDLAKDYYTKALANLKYISNKNDRPSDTDSQINELNKFLSR